MSDLLEKIYYLEKLYCHTKPESKQESWVKHRRDVLCEEGTWYHYVTYRAATRDVIDKSKHTHFDIKEGAERLSRTILCRHISELPLYFWTKEQYRDIMIDKILLPE